MVDFSGKVNWVEVTGVAVLLVTMGSIGESWGSWSSGSGAWVSHGCNPMPVEYLW